MRANAIFRTATTLGLAAVAGTYLSFRREMKEACRRIEEGGTIIETAAGPIEFAREGEGEPLLMIHGAGGGYDQGLLIARDFVAGHDVIAPSRFGYLRTPVPEDSSPAAQAGAHAAVLDVLEVGRAVVVGVSAGAPSAIEMALRHPDRVTALVLVVPRAYSPGQPVGAEMSPSNRAVLKLIQSAADFGYWLAMRFARPAVVRFLGVPPEVEAQAPCAERRRVTEVMRSLLPVSRRVAGLEVDSAAEIKEWPLDKIAAPTLIISAEDDLFRTLPAARYTAEHIKGAELKVLPSGGHLMIGQGAEVQGCIDRFLRRTRPLPKAA